jgi:PAS domain S-box-containing protein
MTLHSNKLKSSIIIEPHNKKTEYSAKEEFYFGWEGWWYMKNNGKASKPIIAARSTKDNGNKSAPLETGKGKGSKARSRHESAGDHDKLKCLVLDRIGDGILAFDAEMNCVYANEQAGKLLGRSPQELLGKNFWVAYPEAKVTPIGEACQRAFETQSVVPFDGYFSPSDTWFAGRVYPSSDGLSVLLTEHNSSEETILQVSHFPVQNPNPVMRFTRDGKLLFANPASAGLLEAWKQQTREGIPPELGELLPLVLESGSNREIELNNQGNTYTCLLVAFPDAGYVNLYFNDISARKQAEDSLQTLIHQTTTGITRTSLDGRFIFVNRAFSDLLGYSQAELTDKTIWEISHPDDIAKNKRMFERMAAEGEAFQLEKRLLRRNGSIVWVNVGTSPLRDAEGKTDSAVSVIVDITRRKRAEETIVDSARRTLYISSLSDAIRSLSNPLQIEIEASRLLGLYLKANRIAYAEVKADGTTIVRSNYVDRAADMTRMFHLSKYIPEEILPIFETGHAFVASEADNALGKGNPLTIVKDADTVQAQIVIPLIRNGELVAAMFVQHFQPRDWKNEEIHLAEETAERVQTAIERTRAEERLRDSEERFRALISQTTAGITQADLESRITFANPRFCEMLGYTESELLGKTIWELTYTDDLQENIRLYKRMLTQGTSYQFEKRFIRKDGSHLWTSVSVTSIYDANGNAIGGVGVVLDISERKRIEEARRIENERFMRFINSNITGIVIGDAQGKIFLANDYYLNLLGMTRQDFVEQKVDWKKFTPPEWLPADEKAIRELQERGISEPYEKEYIRSDGRRVPVYIVNASLPGPDKEIAAFVLDISERKRAEEQLRISEDRLRLAVAGGNIGIWDIDLRRRDRAWSKEAKAIYGLAENEHLDYERQLSLIHPDDRAGVDEMVKKFRDHGTLKQLNLEHRIVHPDGTLRWVEVQGEAIYEDEPLPVRLIGTIVDITERKQYEQSLIEYGRRQTALYTLSDQLHRTNTLEDVFNASLDAILSALQCDRASILLFDETKVMHFVAWRGLSEEYRKATDGHSPWKYGEQNPIPISYDDINTADLSDSLKAVVAKEGIGSLAFIPIVFQGKLIGKFMVYFNTPHVFTTSELDLGLTIARQLAAGVDRKRNEEALRESQQRLSLTYDHAAIGIVETNLKGDIVQCNDEYSRLIGYTKEEILGWSIEDITYEADRLIESKLYEELTAGKLPFYRLEKRYVKKDGSLVWGEVVRSVVRDSSGKALYGIGAVFDITERKQREEAIRARTEEIETLMEVNPIGIFVAHDPECTRITANPAGYQLVQMPMSSYANVSKSAPAEEQPTYKVFRNDVEIPAEDLPMQASARLGMDIEEKNLELRFENGSRKHVYVFAKPLFDNNGKSRGAIAAMLDITDRIENENALRESEERFTRFMQYLPGLAWIKDGQGRYVYANSAAEKAFGAPREKLYGKTDQEIFPAETAAQFKQNDERALAAGKGVQVIETLLQEDGVLHHSLVSKFPIPGSDGTTTLIGGTAFDITERVHMEDALRQARKLAEQTADRMARLQEVTASLAGSSIPTHVAELVLEQATRATGAADGILVEVMNNGQELQTIAALGSSSAVLRMAPVPLSTSTPIADSIRTKKGIWIRSQEEFVQQYPMLAEARRGFGVQAIVALPLLVGDRVVGGLAFSFIEPHEFHLEERGFFLAVAQQCAQGLERAHAEEALHESEERYRAIVNQATAGIVRKAADGKMLFVNQAFCEMLGLSEAQLVGKTMWEFTHPDDVAENRRLFDRLMKEGIPFQLEKRLIRRDGSILWATVSVSPVLDVAGKSQSAVSVYADITERKQAQSRLELLGEVSELIRNMEDPVELMSAVANVVGRHLQVRRCLFNEIDVENDVEIVHDDYHEGTHSVAGVHKISEYSNVTSSEMEAGKTVVNYDSKVDPRTAPDYERSYVPHGERAYVTVPLMRDERWAASLWVSDDKPRRWSKEEVSLLETIAERTWTATEKCSITRFGRALAGHF